MSRKEIRDFGSTKDGTKVHAYAYETEQGFGFEVSDFGATLIAVYVIDKFGKQRDIVLGFEKCCDYENGFLCIGGTVGRVCNRIRNGMFRIDDVEYQVTKNFREGHIHGGKIGFHKKIWEVEELENGFELKYESLDLEENYPGNLRVSVRFTMSEQGVFEIEYIAKSDKDTLCNLTNHAYFNLNGEGTVLEHSLKLYADEFTENDENGFTTGKLLNVEGTPMDFRHEKKVGEDIYSEYGQIKWFGGYDSNYVVRDYKEKKEMRKVAELYSTESGIKMLCETTMPGFQIYTANHLSGEKGKKGSIMNRYDAICIETQYFPNSMEHDNFEKPILRKNEEYHQITRYSFSNTMD